jgi:hypothetical protein
VRHWVRQHNQQVKQGGAGVRIVVCHLPSKSPLWSAKLLLASLHFRWCEALGRVPAGCG